MFHRAFGTSLAYIVAGVCLAAAAQAKVNFCGSSAVADVVLFNASSRHVAVWCDGNPSSSLIFGPVASGWNVAGVASFNGPLVSDILLVNEATGDVSIWPGGNAAASVITGRINTAAGYVLLESFGDLNGDGRDDIILYSPSLRSVAVWYSADVSTSAVLGTYVSGWTPYHVADVTSDGRADLILRETDADGRGTGRYSGWAQGNPESSFFMTTPGSPWELMATGNFFPDAPTCDALWYNAYSGALAKSPGCASSILSLTSLGVFGWPLFPVMAEDMNGDGVTDLVVRHYNASTITWMNGGATTVETVLGVHASSAGWSVLDFPYRVPYAVHIF